MKKILILILAIFCFTGCNSYTELNDLSIVSTIGIDYQDNKYLLMISTIDGKKQDNSIEKKIITYESKKSNLEEAFQEIYLKSDKKLYLSHLDLLILTKNAINQKLPEIINNFLENNEYRNNFDVAYLNNYSLSDFKEDNVLAETINNLIKTNQKETGFTNTKDFETLLKELLIDKNSYLPTITIENKELTLKGFTLIRDYQVYKELTLEESILLNMLQNKIQKSYLNDTNIIENQTMIRTKNNKIYFKFLTTVSNKSNYQEKTRKELETFLKTFQSDNYDILKLTEKVRKNNYKYYQNTKDLLSKLEFYFDFDLKEKENYLERNDTNEKK